VEEENEVELAPEWTTRARDWESQGSMNSMVTGARDWGSSESHGDTKGPFGKAPASLAPDPDPREELILLILLENQNHF
jgi:hypothetical protein